MWGFNLKITRLLDHKIKGFFTINPGPFCRKILLFHVYIFAIKRGYFWLKIGNLFGQNWVFFAYKVLENERF